MQLIQRYLLKNRITLVVNEYGYSWEYMPVYNRQIKLFRGIDNTIQFRLLNADQKPIDLSLYTPKFVAFDENENLIFDKTGEINTIDDSSASRGLFTVTIYENDMLNLPQQFIRFNVYLIDVNGNKQITYNNSHFDNNGTIFIDHYAFPGPSEPIQLSTFTENGNFWTSESISAEPAINNNSALHTYAIYANGYIGNLELKGTLDTSSSSTDWALLDTITFDGSESEPVYGNFFGVFNYIQFAADANPANKLTKILIKN